MTIPWVIKSFRGGISDETNKGIKGSFKNGYNLMIHSGADTIQCNYAMKSFSPGVFEDLILFFVVGADGSLYGFGDNGRIYSKSTNAFADLFVKRFTGANGSIRGAASWGIDTGANYLMWATSTSVARKQMITDNSGMDWGNAVENWSTTLTSAIWHTMQRACGALMIANERYLAMMEYDATYDPQAMHIEPGQEIKCLEGRDDYVIMGSENPDEDSGYLWSWITTATNYVQKKKLPVSSVNALISSELMIAQGGIDGDLVFSDFTNTIPLHAFTAGGETYPGAVALYHGLSMFGVWNSGSTWADQRNGLWTYGRAMKNRPMALNWEYRLSVDMAGSSVSRVGAVMVNSGAPYASWRTVDGSTTAYGVDQLDPTAKAVAVYESLEFDGGSPHLRKQFATAKVIMEPLPAGCSIAFKYKMDGATSWTTALTANGSATYTNTGGTEAEFIINNQGRFCEVGLTLTPSGINSPEIRAIITYIDDNFEEH